MKLNQEKDFVIQIKNFTIGYDSGPIILDNISCNIPYGVRCAIIGLNGSGKTTFLKGILELEKNRGGQVFFFNQSLSVILDKMAYVPQIKTIDWSFPITVENVVKMGCYRTRNFFSFTLNYDWKEKVHYALEKMNLLKKRNNHINDLSGGEKQRVFIARAIAQDPQLYILDEPLTALDMLSEKIITDLLKEITEKKNTVIAVHHDLHTLYDYFNWVIIINKGISYYGPLSKEIVEPHIRKAFSKYL